MKAEVFSPSYDLAPLPPIPLPSESCLSVFLCVAGLAYISLFRIFPVLGPLYCKAYPESYVYFMSTSWAT